MGEDNKGISAIDSPPFVHLSSRALAGIASTHRMGSSPEPGFNTERYGLLCDIDLFLGVQAEPWQAAVLYSPAVELLASWQ